MLPERAGSPLIRFLLALTLYISASSTFVSAQDNATENPFTFDWSSIEPSANLTWTECYTSPLQCSRLSVPLNYSDPSAGSAALALIRVPSPHANTSSYKGPIVYNPGGPGVSGVQDLVLGHNLQERFGEEFDFVSFDPRGVQYSTPNIRVFNSTAEEDAFSAASPDLLSLEPSSWDSLPDRLKEVDEFGTRVAESVGDVIKHFTTDNAARDILTIAEAHGREKVMYYGISYGTILGSTFASMFPDKIERLVIDGVADVEGYYQSNDWIGNILDADKTLRVLFSNCVAAGPSDCPFYSPTVQELEDRFTTMLKKVDEDPIKINDNTTYGLAAIEGLVHSQLDTPRQYVALAAIMKAVEERNLTALGGAPSGVGNSSDMVNDIGPQGGLGFGRYGLPINCLDGGRTNGTDSADELIGYAKKVQKVSKWFLSQATNKKVLCSGWKVHPDNFRGPIGGNTSYPIMLIGNTADPITPLASARKRQRSFPGSKLLVNDAPGHTSNFWPSNCVTKYLHNYFQNGTLPEDDAFCAMTGTLFPLNATGIESGRGLNGTVGRD